MAEVKAKKGESFDSLLRRFNRKILMSGRLIQAKKVRFHAEPKTKLELRRSALHRAKTRAMREWQIKTGLVTEEELEQERKAHKRR